MITLLSSTTLFIFLYNTRQVTSFLVICFVLTLPAIYWSERETGTILALSFFSYAFGGLIYNCNSKQDVSALIRISFLRTKSVFRKDRHRLLYTAIFLGVTCTFISSVYFAVVGISILSENVGVARLENRNSIPGAFIFQRFFRVLFPTVVILLYGLYISTPNRSYSKVRLSWVFLTIFLIINGSFLVFTGIKGNIITFLIIPLVIFHNLYVARTTLLGLFLLFGISTIFLYFLVSNMIPNANFLGLVQFILFRLGSGATDGLHYVIHIYQPAYGYQYGATIIQDIFSIFGKLGVTYFDDKSLGQKIASDLLGAKYRGEQAAVTLSGELFLNFGRFGLVLASVLVGYFLQYIYVYSLRKNLTALKLVFLSYLQAATILILGGPVFSMLLDYLIFCGFFLVVWRLTFSMFRQRSFGGAR